MNLLSALLLISFCFSQYNYSLEDVNETSPYHGDSIGVPFLKEVFLCIILDILREVLAGLGSSN